MWVESVELVVVVVRLASRRYGRQLRNADPLG